MKTTMFGFSPAAKKIADKKSEGRNDRSVRFI
jgi:hypothetical protein